MLKAGVPTPAIYLVDETERKIYMEYLGHHALTLKDFIRQLDHDFKHPIFNQIVAKLAKNLALMHLSDNIHGDLTSSNMMIRPKLPSSALFTEQAEAMTARQMIDESLLTGDIGELYLIDFGLSFVSNKIEDKAVDIYVLKRAFISTHPGSEPLWEKILEEYRKIMVSK